MPDITLIDVTERSHWERYTELANHYQSHHPLTVDELIESAAQAPPEVPKRRCLVRLDGEEIGAFVTSHGYWTASEGYFRVSFYPNPDRDDERWAALVFDSAESTARELGAKQVGFWADTRFPDLMRLVESKGYDPGQTNPFSMLDLTTFDPERWAQTVDKVRSLGYRVATWAERETDLPEYRKHWWRFEMDAFADVPLPYPFQEQPFETWERDFHSGGIDETLQFAVFDGDKVAAGTGLFRNKVDPTILSTGLTATGRDYRRQGLATAIKVLNLAEAKARGGEKVYTDNEENNPMLGLNVALGFKVVFQTVHYTRDLD